MILTNNYYYFKKALPLRICKKILAACHTRHLQEAVTVGSEKEWRGKTKHSPRECKVAWIAEQWIYDILNPFIHMANKKAGWNFQWDWNETSQYTCYTKGHFYGWHTDQSPNPFKHSNKNMDGKHRKISLTLQLTDEADYEGGDFQFAWFDFEKKNLLEIRTIDDAKKMGTIIIFPSFIYHQVLPVTKGKRESLVNWSIGNAFN